MPELPVVDVVRRGLVSWVRGRTITSVDVLDPRSIRRHALGTEDFAGNLEGATVVDVVRRDLDRQASAVPFELLQRAPQKGCRRLERRAATRAGPSRASRTNGRRMRASQSPRVPLRASGTCARR